MLQQNDAYNEVVNKIESANWRKFIEENMFILNLLMEARKKGDIIENSLMQKP
jgi:hypothetical protein